MGGGDILLLYTDGLQAHTRGDDPYFPDRLEHTIRGAKHLSAIDIMHTVLDDLRAFANPADDVSLVVINKF
jgi:serine phosphatase RsbU (regulator of sigma subunit)